VVLQFHFSREELSFIFVDLEGADFFEVISLMVRVGHANFPIGTGHRHDARIEGGWVACPRWVISQDSINFRTLRLSPT
jgi:hypothetical protein